MLNISANTFKSLRDALLQCGPFESNQKLRAVFAHPSLLPWQAGLPEAENVVDRVDILIDYLKKAHLNTGEPVLPIFFRILAERYDPQNLCYRLLSDLARELDHSYASVKLSVNPPRPIDDRSYDHRLNKKIYDLQQQWELLNEKLNGFNEQWILETRVEEKLRLRKLVDDTKIQCDQVEEQLKEMERQLAKVDSDAQEAAGRNDDRGHDRPRSGDAPRGATQHPHKDFFVSYNGADRQWAEWIAWQLEAAGYTTVIQAWDFRPGSNFVLEMQKASEQVERTIAVYRRIMFRLCTHNQNGRLHLHKTRQAPSGNWFLSA